MMTYAEEEEDEHEGSEEVGDELWVVTNAGGDCKHANDGCGGTNQPAIEAAEPTQQGAEHRENDGSAHLEKKTNPSQERSVKK